MSSTSSAASEDLVSDLSEPGCEPLPSASETLSAGLSCASTGPMSSATTTCESSPQLALLPMESKLMPSAPASPAKTSALRAKRPALTANRAACGCSARGSFENCGHILCWVRMLLRLECEVQTGCSVTWRNSATPQNRSWSVLCSSERLSLARESGLWPRPAARDYRQDGKYRSAQSRFSPCLPAAVCIAQSQEAARHSGRGRAQDWLNHHWVSGLMGFPHDWCDLPMGELSELSAIPSPRKSRKSSGGQ